MGGVKEVRQRDDRHLHWVAEIAGVRREWGATILEQVPDQKIAWAAKEGATNAGAVRFEPLGAGSTLVHLSLEYEPEGLVEQVGDKLGLVERQVESDLQRFKALVESEGYATGGWRGSVNPNIDVGTPGASAAHTSRGDSGKAGVSGKAVAAGAAVAGAAAAAAAAAASRTGQGEEQPATRVTEEIPAAPQPPVREVREEVVVEDVSSAAPAPGASTERVETVRVGPDDDLSTGRGNR
ncbi:SRPBCC family protein [Blastococcus sp. KM273128]|uniref:SRPBCC family protein n=1 Tax=Blastococcus sp. KM273128 TaxID=2570314 RepID=UPI001F45B390|nr:SRPBCC family protein [Blastococcus sp. KM273128]